MVTLDSTLASGPDSQEGCSGLARNSLILAYFGLYPHTEAPERRREWRHGHVPSPPANHRHRCPKYSPHSSPHELANGRSRLRPHHRIWNNPDPTLELLPPIRACEVTVDSTTVCSCVTRSVSGRSRSARVPVRGFCARGSSALSRFADIGCRQHSSGNSLPLPLRVRHGACHRPGWVAAQYARPKNSRTRSCSLEHHRLGVGSCAQHYPVA